MDFNKSKTILNLILNYYFLDIFNFLDLSFLHVLQYLLVSLVFELNQVVQSSWPFLHNLDLILSDMV